MTASVEKDVTVTSSAHAMAGSLQQLAEVVERVASTAKKLEKTAFVGNCLQQLDDADRGRAARYFGWRPANRA